MVESEQKPKWEFKHLHGRDAMNTRSGAQMRMLAEMASKSAGVSWKEVQNMPIKLFLNFITEFAKSEGLDEFGEYDFLGNE